MSPLVTFSAGSSSGVGGVGGSGGARPPSVSFVHVPLPQSQATSHPQPSAEERICSGGGRGCGEELEPLLVDEPAAGNGTRPHVPSMSFAQQTGGANRSLDATVAGESLLPSVSDSRT